MKHADTSFDWLIYADATFAGLAVLIPIPPLDLLMEAYFRRRILRTIAKRRKTKIPSDVMDIIHREGCCSGCFTWPLTLIIVVLKRISRKILYFLTIKEASDMLSFYWHRAFLLDYMLAAGHLQNQNTAVVARQALDEILLSTTTSPLGKIAAEIVDNARHIWTTLRRIRRNNEEDEVVAESRSLMDEQWAEAAGYLEQLAAAYQTRFDTLRLDQQIQLFEQDVQVAQYEPPVKGNNNDRQETNPPLQTENSQTETEPGGQINPRRRKKTAKPPQEEKDQQRTGRAENPEGE
ncbi:MAG: hypothetical protein KDE51_01225 [Anaerolineales bacterium]|nr:hypothetical protein [Anaerolineales bacterium]